MILLTQWQRYFFPVKKLSCEGCRGENKPPIAIPGPTRCELKRAGGINKIKMKGIVTLIR